MTHFLLTDNTKSKNEYNIPEPVDGIEVPFLNWSSFVPLLAFDKEGHRVGYGKGFMMYFLKPNN
jgi:5-formyltetrahydrofolate cyclo-ligase